MKETDLTISNQIIQTEDFDDEMEFRRLSRSISLSEKYFLFFAVCNQLPKQKRIINKIKKQFSDKNIAVIEFKKPIKGLLGELEKKLKNKKPDAVFVTGLRYSIPGEKKGKETSFIANLNITRDAFPKILDCPLILFLPEYAIRKIMNGAPDFSSVRSGIFFFANDEKILLNEISQAVSVHDALLPEERFQRLIILKELLAQYQSLPNDKRDFETEYQLKNKLADIYYKIADFSASVKITKELLEDVRHRDEIKYSNQLNNLANFYNSRSRYDEATELYKQALLIDEKTIGKEHPDYAVRLNNLAMVYNSQSRYDEAIELYKQALLIDEKTIGKEHPDYAVRLNNLATAYNSQSRYDEATELYKQALLIDEKTIGKEHPNYAVRLNNLAGIYDSQGRYDEAIELYKQVLQIDEKTIGKEHPDYAADLNNLAGTYRSQGRYEEALTMYEEALRLYLKFFGRNHPNTQLVKSNLKNCFEKMKNKL